MHPPQILLVDDSLTVRRVVANVLREGGYLVVESPDGEEALHQVGQSAPDLMVLDINMPRMDGLALLRELRKKGLRFPIIMFSDHTESGAQMTLEALAMGASDYVLKPKGVTGPAAARAYIQETLLPRVHALIRPKGGERAAVQREASPGPRLPKETKTARELLEATRARIAEQRERRLDLSAQPEPMPATRPRPVPESPPVDRLRRVPKVVPAKLGKPKLVVVGASTGGPEALSLFVEGIPADFPLPVVVVQHMPTFFTGPFAQRLNTRCKIPVALTYKGLLLDRPGVWIAAGDTHSEIVATAAGPQIQFTSSPPEHGCRPSVNPLFRSAAQHYPGEVLGIIFTGMGQDGLEGAQALVDSGGEVWAQDEESCVVWGMPRAVTEAGIVSRIAPPTHLAEAMVSFIQKGSS